MLQDIGFSYLQSSPSIILSSQMKASQLMAHARTHMHTRTHMTVC